jgi:C4-dicarboxylate-specific signal transduction histidine kinase
MPVSPRMRFALQLALMALAMLAIFVVDTTTSYEVAAAVFYTIVILAAARVLPRRALVGLSGVCIALTVLSFAFTPHGDLRAGLVNMGISMAAIGTITYLVVKMEAAQAAARDAQAQLLRIARVKSLDGLTASIAHEVNQPLAAIVTSGNACQRWLAQDPPKLDKARQALARIVDDAGRASSIIVRVRSLTRGTPPHKSAFDFNEAITEILGLSRAELERNGIALALDLAPGLPPAFADRVQIQQVVGNLVLNAVEALAAVPPSERSLRIASQRQDEALRLNVADSGMGIAAAVHAHVFEAFWTTKDEGVGIGLAISRTIVEANGGQIWAEPDQVRGAVFCFSVPAAEQGRKSA